MSVIKVQGLSKNFGAIKAVDQLSFEVEAGQVYGFLGQNGSGKSTTIRMLLSLIHPSQGHIEIFGQSLTDNRSAILEKVGAVIERPDSYPYLTAQEHLSLFAKLRKQKITAAKIEATLSQVGLLASLAKFFDDQFSDIRIIAIVIGLLSSVVVNVPMVAALQSMYSLDIYPTDHYFWELLAFTAGTGGSCLIIGSAAGVAVMGMEKIDFFWYLKKISWIALIGFISGVIVFLLQHGIQ